LYAKQPSLDGKFTIFGQLIDGFETLEKLEKEAVGKANRPLNDIKIKDVTIHANPFAVSDWEEDHERHLEETAQQV
jgi:peptidyl-prolyl cis-trans isomerase-like 3